MIKIKLEKAIDGLQLSKELNIELSQLWADENYLYINAEIDETKAQNILKAHKIETKKDLRASALAKLAALGLTEDEIAAL